MAASTNKQDPDPICIQSLLLSSPLRWNYLWKGTATNLREPEIPWKRQIGHRYKILGGLCPSVGHSLCWVCLAGFDRGGTQEWLPEPSSSSLSRSMSFSLYFLCSPEEEGRDRAAVGPARVSHLPIPSSPQCQSCRGSDCSV